MSEFKGKAGTIYIEKSKAGDDHPYAVWFEDFCILGDGDSEIEALQDAKRHAEDIVRLVSSAIIKTLMDETATATSAAGGE